MKKITRIVVAVISVSLIATFFVPMWFIDLEAPQYPEGLGFNIWLYKMGGDLDIVNNLNHYIGMKTIHPESIPELVVMPYLIGFLIVLGLIAAFIGNKKLFTGWAAFYIVLGIVGMIDFYMWGYDYGHDLDPRAAIKIPDMTYQPPLMGSKQLLNFTAHSYPHIGGGIIMAGAFLSLLFLWKEFFQKKKISQIVSENKNSSQLKWHKEAAAVLGFAVLLSSCSIEPRPIQYGHDQCALCRMTISDSRYGTELLTSKGKVFVFDSIECMVEYKSAGQIDHGNIHSLLITDYANPGTLVDAISAYYIITPNHPSPMGANLTGFASQEDAEKFIEKYEGNLFNWEQLKHSISIKS
jgi:copper chaperone NosL